MIAGVLWESIMLVGAGGLLALPLGAALSLWLDAILRSMPGLPAQLHFFVFEPRALGSLRGAADDRIDCRRSLSDAHRVACCRSRRRSGGRWSRDGGDCRSARVCRKSSRWPRDLWPRCARSRSPSRPGSTSALSGLPAAASPRCFTCSASSTCRPAARCSSTSARLPLCPMPIAAS